MKCPQCGAWTLVLDTRMPAGIKNVKRRRYECANMHRFATMEYVDPIGRSSSSTKKGAVLSTLPRAGKLPGLKKRKQDGE